MKVIPFSLIPSPRYPGKAVIHSVWVGSLWVLYVKSLSELKFPWEMEGTLSQLIDKLDMVGDHLRVLRGGGFFSLYILK